MRLQEARVRLGLTQRGLAEKAGVNHSIVSRIEAGTYTPGPKVMHAVAVALEKTLDDIDEFAAVLDAIKKDPALVSLVTRSARPNEEAVLSEAVSSVL